MTQAPGSGTLRGMAPDDEVEDPEGDGGEEHPPADLLELYEALEWESAVGDGIE